LESVTFGDSSALPVSRANFFSIADASMPISLLLLVVRMDLLDYKVYYREIASEAVVEFERKGIVLVILSLCVWIDKGV
jgi:hypothetical protein